MFSIPNSVTRVQRRRCYWIWIRSRWFGAVPHRVARGLSINMSMIGHTSRPRFLSVAVSRVFASATGGRSKERQALADKQLDLTAEIAVIPCRGGEPFLRDLFEPLEYQIEAEHHPLDDRFPQWGESSYYTVRLRGRKRLRDLLTHLYVLIPVLDAEKHYWVEMTKSISYSARARDGWQRTPRKKPSQHATCATITGSRGARSRNFWMKTPDPEPTSRSI